MSNISAIRQSLNHILEDASSIARADFENALRHGVDFEEKVSLIDLPDFVSQTDKKLEKYLSERLNDHHPEIAFVGEETGGNIDSPEFFLVDPLDGTSNFVSLRSYFGICAAYVKDGDVLAAGVADPMNKRILTAAKDEGVFLNGRKISPATRREEPLRSIQLECELTFSSHGDFELVEKLLPHMSGMRKSGSTALDFCYMATGRKMICIANHLKPYDIAAPILIAREAGYVVSDFQGNPASIHSDRIIAGAPLHHKRTLEIILQ